VNAGLRRSGLLVPGALALVGLLILLGLGSWQIERKA
jgi:cytochrome oxidase assembly protein ShyY1